MIVTTTAAASMPALRFNRPTPVVVRLQRLRRMPVVALSARRLGHIEAVYLDPTTSRVTAIAVPGGADAARVRIPAARIRRVGTHAVILGGREGGRDLRATPAQAAAVVQDRESRYLAPEIAAPEIAAEHLLGMEVLDDGGDRIGCIHDVYLHRETLAIAAYELETPWLESQFRGPRLILPAQVHACSHDLMIADRRAAIAAPSATGFPERPFPVGWEERRLRVPGAVRHAAPEEDAPDSARPRRAA
jgi:sporulation protein YlmC with PRC-barrel domain